MPACNAEAQALYHQTKQPPAPLPKIVNKNSTSLPTPICAQQLQTLLQNYPNRNFLIEGFTHGFRLQYHGPPQTYEIVNNKSVRENEQQVI